MRTPSFSTKHRSAARMAPDPFLSSSNEQATTGSSRTSTPTGLHLTSRAVPVAATPAKTSSVGAAGAGSSPQPARTSAMRSVLLALSVLLTAAILPASASSAASAAPLDVWTGSWPAQLMPTKEPLGMLTWREIRESEGRAMVGQNFGGRPFECGEAGPSRFFRGNYADGGDLVACTTGADGRSLVGRFNGNETFKSGSFEVTIISEAPRIFFGKYFEDEGIVTDWCGVLGTKGVLTPETVDIGAPFVRALAASGRVGSVVSLRASALDNSGAAATLRLTISRNGRTLQTLSLPARADGGIVTARWRAPKALRGEYVLCARAVDAAGNESSRTCTTLRLR
jgi:hypothetical protein